MSGTRQASLVAFDTAYMTEKYAMHWYREHEVVGKAKESIEQIKNGPGRKHQQQPALHQALSVGR